MLKNERVGSNEGISYFLKFLKVHVKRYFKWF